MVLEIKMTHLIVTSPGGISTPVTSSKIWPWPQRIENGSFGATVHAASLRNLSLRCPFLLHSLRDHWFFATVWLFFGASLRTTGFTGGVLISPLDLLWGDRLLQLLPFLSFLGQPCSNCALGNLLVNPLFHSLPTGIAVKIWFRLGFAVRLLRKESGKGSCEGMTILHGGSAVLK